MSEVYANRRSRLREYVNAAGTAAALVTRPANVRYLAAASPRGSVLLLGRREDVLVCAGPPDDRPHEGRPDENLRLHVLPSPGGDTAVAAAGLAVAQEADSLAVEEHHLTVTRHRAIASVAPKLRLTDLATAVEQLRVVKDEEEISCLRIGAEI
ncbi:aminopeptidase P family N-terminal domain-containing protein, partial [Streptomyces tricolor]